MRTLPQPGKALSKEHLAFLSAFTKSCRRSIIAMTNQAQSGHPGGSLSSIDYLSLLYAFIISQTKEKVIVSNGHISPAVYSVLAEMGWVDKNEVIDTFRQAGSIYEGHVTRHVPGVWYGTGPLGIGISAASGFATAARLNKSKETIYVLIGDGESQEGIVYEMMQYANKYKLSNMVVFVDYNRVQLSDALDTIMPINIAGHFKAAGWRVISCDGHNYQKLWKALSEGAKEKNMPTLILGKTIMGKGVEFMEKDGRALKATWHGKSASPEESSEILKSLLIAPEEETLIENFRKKFVRWKPEKPFSIESSMPSVKQGLPRILPPGTVSDCRSAYGKALLDLAELNRHVVALTADLGGSVKTDVMGKKFPERVFDVGIAEQHMVSCSGGLSLSGKIPFCSTFGTFMTSRAKDQARVNDINRTNVKMVATHCGLSVGEDGPTHQAIDDMGSFLGFFNTKVLEPADANQCDHIIRYIAGHYGNFYVRMGRHTYPVLTKEDGSVFYDEHYEFQPGKADLLRKGTEVTVVSAGSMCDNVMKALGEIGKKRSVELLILSSLSPIDATAILRSAKKTGKILTIEDHNPRVGYGNAIAEILARSDVQVKIQSMGVMEYQLSGKAKDLYEMAGLGVKDIVSSILKL